MIGFTTPPRFDDTQLRLDWRATAHDIVSVFALHSYDRAGIVNHMPDSDLPAHIHVEIEPAGMGQRHLTTEIQFDDDPRLTAEWRRRSQQERFVIAKVTIDSAGRQQAVTDVLGNTTTTVYDTNGRVSATIDQYGHRTTTIYDSVGRAAHCLT